MITLPPSSTATKTITGVERKGTREGHPHYRVTFSDGTDALTKPGAAINYGVTNRDLRNVPVEVVFDGNLLIGVARVGEPGSRIGAIG